MRDVNSYPRWVDGVDSSRIEEGLPGTAVGGVRVFTMGGASTRQRLVAHSDVERFFSYESCEPIETELDGVARTMHHYRGTLRLGALPAGVAGLASRSCRRLTHTPKRDPTRHPTSGDTSLRAEVLTG